MKKRINYQGKIELLLNTVPHHLKVQFALFCAKDCRQYANPKDLEVIDKALTLVEKWLKDNNTVTEQQLRDAADAVYADAYSYAAHAAYDAAYDAAYAVAYAAAASNAYAAANAYDAAAYAANASNKEEKLKYYYDYLATLIANISKLEKIVYGL